MNEISNESEIKKIPISPKTEVISFLHKVWSHPLLDEKTIQHRRQFQQRFQDWCRSWGINPNEVVAVLVGSSLWTTERLGYAQGSDWDFILYGPKEIIESYKYKRAQARLDPHAKEKYEDRDIHPDAVYDETEIKYVRSLAPLLLTPDNFIAGNINLAHQYRLRLNQLANPNQNNFEYQFDHYMRNWRLNSIGSKRENRFNEALNRVAKEKSERVGRPVILKDEPFTQKYKSLFLKALEEIKPPSLDVYKKALIETKGALVLPPTLGKNITRL